MKLAVMLLVLSSLLFTSLPGFAESSKAPALQLPSLDGEMNLAQLQGKVVYLDFWASWCDPCRDSFPWMAAIKEKYGASGFEVVAVNLDRDRALADEFLKKMTVNFVVAFDASGESAEQYNLRGMPASYLIGRDGSIQASHLGFNDSDKAKLEAAIRVLLLQR